MSRRKGPRSLSPEERIIWEKVKRTAEPLHKNPVSLQQYLDQQEDLFQGNIKPDVESTQPAPSAVKSSRVVKPYAPEPRNRPIISHSSSGSDVNRLEHNTVRKIAKGRISIDGRVDLHGLTQLEAHDRLFRFLEEAWLRQKRTVLVITGKGKGEGILRRAVPRWLAEAAFRTMVSGVSEAHTGHGGAGALYVRIKRRKEFT